MKRKERKGHELQVIPPAQRNQDVPLIWPGMFVVYNKPTKEIGPRPIYLVSCPTTFDGSDEDNVFLTPCGGYKAVTTEMSFGSLQETYRPLEDGSVLDLKIQNTTIREKWLDEINEVIEEDDDEEERGGGRLEAVARGSPKSRQRSDAGHTKSIEISTLSTVNSNTTPMEC